MKLRRNAAVVAAVLAITSSAAAMPASAGTNIGGGGASFVANAMEKCTSLYNGNSTYNTGGDIVTYSSVGSGAGKTGFASTGVGGAGTYKFGGTESKYSSGAPSGFVYVPIIGGPIAVAYKLDGVTPAGQPIKLTGELVAKIFAGQIKMWNDPAIAAVNKGTVFAKKVNGTAEGVTVTASKVGANASFKIDVNANSQARFKGKKITVNVSTNGITSKVGASKVVAKTLTLAVKHKVGQVYTIKAGIRSIGTFALAKVTVGKTLTFPATPIRVAYRSDTSGTTNNFANYLNMTNPSIWTKPTNDAFTTAFPGSIPTDGTFQGAKGNDGVSNYVRDNNGAITYAELSFVKERGLGAIAVQNNAGLFMDPTVDASANFFTTAEVAADGLATLDYKTKDEGAYLINAIAYGLAGTAANATNAAVKSYLNFFLTQCAPKEAAAINYTALKDAILAKALAQVAKVNAG
ncbi:MAG: hypothetical protein RLZ18_1105 [Actinomycetota bacterium]|jgi:ABC-type phosphate transport system substrate-binding protein